jgi:glycine dehydrogenase
MATENFIIRHNGPRDHEIEKMCAKIGVKSINELIDKTVPSNIRLTSPLNLPDGKSEFEYLNDLRKTASKNKLFKSYIGKGYYGTITPSVILRNILENPSWYTSYTPYQAEISQGRLEALLNYQTVVIELTKMEIANASLLDEATAGAEAMIMMHNTRSREKAKSGANILFVDNNVFPQTLAVIHTHATPLGIEVVTGDFASFTFNEKCFGAIIQYPASNGIIYDYKSFVEKCHSSGVMVAVAADILSLVLLTPPGDWGADIVFGSTQRFGIPMGFGGPHAAYFATREAFKRTMPGRIIGVSVDTKGRTALRMALQTREQHIKRERATSNICTAQALLATMAGMYAVYHGPEGLKRIANHVQSIATLVSQKLTEFGYKQENTNFFDTLIIKLPSNITSERIQKIAVEKEVNFNYIDSNTIGISIDETVTLCRLNKILHIFAEAAEKQHIKITEYPTTISLKDSFKRSDKILKQSIFQDYQSETEMMRYIKKLERKDFSLTHSMISLGSCTMKLNAASEMLPLSWPEFANMHPFAPTNQAEGYFQLMEELGAMLNEITGFAAISFQPNSGAAGEYAGLMVIRKYHESRGNSNRNIVLIPTSAHGTNPASAAQAGMEIVLVDCDERGNININDLKTKAELHKDNLSGFMVTYPSTHGVFESAIIEMTNIIHQYGGQVYMDGANMNAQVGLTSPAHIGADVCHLNLHKTFAIPHGGGGPGVGPICVASHLVDFLPQHPVVKTGGLKGVEAVAAAPFGSASVLTISHAYCTMMGGKGLTEATKYAILNANYIAASLKDYFDILYTGENGFVAHEMILDCRKFKDMAHIIETDIAKRLMDYGFHAPTLSFPVHGTLMVEPTESESLQELDRFIDAMKSIYSEIIEVKDGIADENDNVLRNAPHPACDLLANEWNHKYTREKAAYPLKWVADNKFFPTISRIDDAFGDRNLICTCAPMESYRKEVFELKTVEA